MYSGNRSPLARSGKARVPFGNHRLIILLLALPTLPDLHQHLLTPAVPPSKYTESTAL